MTNGPLIVLVPADDEPGYKAPDQQATFKDFEEKLTAAGAKARPMLHIQKSDAGGSWLAGQWVLEAMPVLTPIGTAIVGYLAAKLGRKVRIKVGDNEIEASSVKEVERLLELLKKKP